MGFLTDLIGAVVSVATAVLDVAIKATVEIIDAAVGAWDDYQKDSKKRHLPDKEIIKQKAREELREVNDELLNILTRYREGGQVSVQQKNRAEYLNQRRNELKKQIDDVDEINVSKEISNTPDAFDKFLIDNDHTHVLQSQVGVSVFGKKCPVCGRDMLIQWPRNITTARVADFFWGCSGWYITNAQGINACTYTTQISDKDLSIFTRSDIPDHQVSSEELTELTLLPGPTEIVTERMNDLISDHRNKRKGADDYRCPTHGEELVLRKKREATSLLDQYFLGCPRWRPNNQGCTYMVKLKSAAQLSTLLRKETGSGIL